MWTYLCEPETQASPSAPEVEDVPSLSVLLAYDGESCFDGVLVEGVLLGLVQRRARGWVDGARVLCTLAESREHELGRHLGHRGETTSECELCASSWAALMAEMIGIEGGAC